ncbi:MAG: hypothetical protein AAFX99_33895, partial [Myxococcota bacterium]
WVYSMSGQRRLAMWRLGSALMSHGRADCSRCPVKMLFMCAWCVSRTVWEGERATRLECPTRRQLRGA